MQERFVKIVFLTSFMISIFFWIPSCAVNPVTGKKEFMLLSETDEIRLGRETDKKIVQQYRVYEDQKLTAYLNDICQRLAKVSHRPNLTYYFKVLDVSVVNAFAVPGGYVYFTRGILPYINSEAELAGLIGHEIGHITARHSAKQYSKTQLAQIGLGVGEILSKDIPMLSGLVQLGVGMLFLRFSRDNEREADDLGIEYSSKVGYDATNMANFFETLERMTPGSDMSGLPSWFSTHPSPENRVQTVRTRAKEWQKKLGMRDSKTNVDVYLSGIDGLIFGDDPRQGYTEENVFYHPDLQFQFPIPVKWKINHNPSQVQMVSEGEDAIMVLSVTTGSSSKETARVFISETGVKVIKSEAIRVNGLPSQRMVSEIQTQKTVYRLISYFMEKGKDIFMFHGLTSVNHFQNYEAAFDHTMRQFKELTDPKRLNVKPDRIRIRPTHTSESLENTLRSFGVQNERMIEIALLNGRYLNQMIPTNTLIKVVEKGRRIG
jgi:predicted Zn-dependent protease